LLVKTAEQPRAFSLALRSALRCIAVGTAALTSTLLMTLYDLTARECKAGFAGSEPLHGGTDHFDDAFGGGGFNLDPGVKSALLDDWIGSVRAVRFDWEGEPR
jgi:hypothetical protein